MEPADRQCILEDAWVVDHWHTVCLAADIEQPVGAGVNVGGGASAVAARTAAILSSKKRCRSHTSIAGKSGTNPWPIKTSIDNHSKAWRGTWFSSVVWMIR